MEYDVAWIVEDARPYDRLNATLVLKSAKKQKVSKFYECYNDLQSMINQTNVFTRGSNLL